MVIVSPPVEISLHGSCFILIDSFLCLPLDGPLILLLIILVTLQLLQTLRNVLVQLLLPLEGDVGGLVLLPLHLASQRCLTLLCLNLLHSFARDKSPLAIVLAGLRGCLVILEMEVVIGFLHHSGIQIEVRASASISIYFFL